MPTSRRAMLGLACGAVASLAACGSPTPGSDATAPTSVGSSASGDAFPVVIDHAHGRTTIKARPQRVATVAWANHEVPLALGVVPVGMAKATWGDDNGDGVLPWVADKLAALGAATPALFNESDGLDFEAVANTKPDLILATYSAVTKEEYAKLSAIAPVIAYPKVPWGTSLSEMVEISSSALGLKQEGIALSKSLKDKSAAIAGKFPILAGKRFIFSSHNATDLSKIGFYGAVDPRVSFLVELGMKLPTIVEEKASSNEFWNTISAEQVDLLSDVDVIVTYGTNADDLRKTLATNPLLSKVPAFKAGRVAVLPNDTPLAAAANPSPLGIDWGLEKYLALIADAAAR